MDSTNIPVINEGSSETISVQTVGTETIGRIMPENVTVVAPTDYEDIDNKPRINEVELVGNKELPDLQVTRLSNLEIEAIINSVV